MSHPAHPFRLLPPENHLLYVPQSCGILSSGGVGAAPLWVILRLFWQKKDGLSRLSCMLCENPVRIPSFFCLFPPPQPDQHLDQLLRTHFFQYLKDPPQYRQPLVHFPPPLWISTSFTRILYTRSSVFSSARSITRLILPTSTSRPMPSSVFTDCFVFFQIFLNYFFAVSCIMCYTHPSAPVSIIAPHSGSFHSISMEKILLS